MVSDIPMHVALVVHDFDPNYGQGRYCVELVERLHGRVRFSIVSNTWNAGHWPGVDWIRVPACRINALCLVYSFIPAAELRVRQLKPDLIHAQGLTCWRSDIITGHICNAERIKRFNTRWIKPRLFAGLVVPLERAFYRHASTRHLIAISRKLEAEVRSNYGWRKPATVIYHGTNLQQFQPPTDAAEKTRWRAHYGLPETAWNWLFMGEAVKGLRQSIDQLVRFPKARLLVVTRSDLERYRFQAANLGVSERVVFHGFDPHPEHAFRAADLFLYPSDYDPFGMVVTEAMASGLPVAVGKDLGSAELFEDRVGGVVFDPHDADDITRALAWLEADPVRTSKLALNGREAVSRITWDACAEQTLAVYQRVHAEKAGG